MSENLVEIEDLDQLDPADLRAVFAEVEPQRVVLALAGIEPGLRKRLLARLPRGSVDPALAQPQVPPRAADEVQEARLSVVDALCRLARRGQIAFDHPEDVLDMVA